MRIPPSIDPTRGSIFALTHNHEHEVSSMSSPVRTAPLRTAARLLITSGAIALTAFSCTQTLVGSGGAGGAGLANSGTGSGSSGCADAVKRILDKEAACKIPPPQTSAASTGSGVCSADTAQRAEAVADCYVAASCAALTGEDPAATAKFGDCLTGATSSTSSSSTTATSSKAVTVGVTSGQNTSSQVASSGTGLSACDTGAHGSLLTGATQMQQQICTSCVQCSQTDLCMTEWQAYTSDTNYTAYLACNNACAPANTACFTNCSNLYPAADTKFSAAISCSICTECKQNCDAANSCV